MADYSSDRESNSVPVVLAAASALGEIRQLDDGGAGWGSSTTAGGVGATRYFDRSGVGTVTKTAGVAFLKGGRAYWDHSANAATYKKVNDRDFYLGRFAAAAASADTECSIDFGADPRYDIDLGHDPFESTPVGTKVVGAFGYPLRLGIAHVLELDSQNEAQKVELISVDGFAKTANWVVEGAFRVLNDGAGSAPDFSIGLASGTHATDFQSVAEFVALHLDGNSTNINAESDDGTTDVAPTDTTIDYTEGATVAERVEFWLDGSNPNDVQVYINGALVLDGTAFTLAAAAGTLYLIAHLEKTSATDVYRIAIDWLRVRLREQD